MTPPVNPAGRTDRRGSAPVFALMFAPVFALGSAPLFVLVSASWLLLGFSPHSNAQQFGRFFTTPEERKYLQELKRQEPKAEKVIELDDFMGLEETERAREALPPMNRVTLKGVVYRKDGPRTAWINHSNTYEADPPMGGMKIEEGGIGNNHVILELPGGPVRLKVGQSYDPQSGSVSDVTDKDMTGKDRTDKDITDKDLGEGGPAGSDEKDPQ